MDGLLRKRRHYDLDKTRPQFKTKGFFFFCVRCDDRAKSSGRWLLGSLPPELGAYFSVFWPKLAYCLQVWAGLKNVLRGLLLRATFTVG